MEKNHNKFTTHIKLRREIFKLGVYIVEDATLSGLNYFIKNVADPISIWVSLGEDLD